MYGRVPYIPRSEDRIPFEILCLRRGAGGARIKYLVHVAYNKESCADLTALLGMLRFADTLTMDNQLGWQASL